MDIQVKLDVNRYMLLNIFITALEGGSNHWYFIADEAMGKVEKAVPYNNGNSKSTSERIFEAVYDKGVVIDINDVESEGDVIGTLDRSKFQERLQLCTNEYTWAIMEELAGQGDASSSDTIFQFLCFGEVIYC